MEFRILGLLEVVSAGDVSVPIGPGKESALLAVLLLRANEPISVDGLVELLWEDGAPANAAKTVQIYVSRLRKRLGAERLFTTPGGYLVRVDTDELDGDRFERLAREGRRALERGSTEEAMRLLVGALALWRGPPLADFRYDSFAQDEIRRLDELHDSVVADSIDARLALGEGESLLPELESLTRANRHDERLQGQLMLCLYRCGRQADALDAYGRARSALVEELGVEPSRRLRELQQAILRQDPRIEAATPRGSAAGDPRRPFVGRERELEELESGLDSALCGRGSLALIVGEPGIGKSRLAEELSDRARARGAEVLVGRSWEAGGAPAYWPWVQLLRTHVRQTDSTALRSQLGRGGGAIAQVLPELREMFSDLPVPAPSESESARFQLFDAISQFLRRAALDRPLVLGLDDLHAADASSLLLLQFVARDLDSSPVLVLAALRDVDPLPGEPLTALLSELARESGTRRLTLTGLSEGAVAEYLERSASEIASPDLAGALHRETEGNPLFVAETVRLLASDELRAEATAGKIAIPQSVRDVITRRLAHLSEDCNRTLVYASVLGREFDLAALAILCENSENELLDDLDEAMAARVVSDVPGARGRLRFSHVLVRDTLYEELTTARRVRLHRLAVAALASLHGTGDQGAHLAELAHHAVAGSDFDTGLAYAHQAGDRALALLAYEDAARLYETALEVLDLARPSDDGLRCELLLSLGEAESRAGNTAKAKTAFLDGAAIARLRGLGREFARAAAGYGGRFMWARPGHDAELVPMLEEALATLPDETDSVEELELRARLLARLAGALRDEPTRDRRDALSHEAVEVARRSGSLAALACALDGRSAAIQGPDTVEECLALSSELRGIATRSGDLERLANAYDNRRSALVLTGELRLAARHLDAEDRTFRKLRQPAHLFQLYSARAMFALATGTLDEAEALIEEAFGYGERTLPDVAIPVYRLQRYTLCDFQGKPEEALPGLRDLVNEYPTRPAFRCALAHLQTRIGRAPEAQQILAEFGRTGFSTLPFDQEWLYGMSLLAETAAVAQDAESAEPLYALLLPWAQLNAGDHPEGIRGSVSGYLAMLATTTKQWTEAERHFQDAIRMNTEMGARPWLAHTLAGYARMLLARQASGAGERAGRLLSEGLSLYRELSWV
jgi:DNA-binding SARP family transcriptional activator